MVFMSMFMSKLVQVNVQAIHQLRLTRCFIVITPRGATEVAISLCLASYCVCVPNVDLNTRPQTSRRRELHSADDPIPTPIQNLVVHFTFALSWQLVSQLQVYRHHTHSHTRTLVVHLILIINMSSCSCHIRQCLIRSAARRQLRNGQPHRSNAAAR